ncbi:hypothetical protein IJ732_03815 [bacterium]|nr:hypothetical protein [bacterium]
MKKIFALILSIMFCGNFTLAAEMFDTSIDDEIRKNYKVDDISLPPLPQIYYSKENHDVEIETKNEEIKLDNPISVEFKTKAVLKRGTKLKLRSLSSISDKTKVGTKVSFILLYPVTTTYMTIPANTIFTGKVIKRHLPQKGGNGGLITIELTSVKINGQNYALHANVTKAANKHVYFNKIKGKRTYLSSIPKTMRWGRNYKNKMYKMTKNFAKDGSTMILCPFSAIFGTLGYAGNLLLSPILAIKYRGNSISLKKGSVFVFKLTEDLNFY